MVLSLARPVKAAANRLSPKGRLAAAVAWRWLWAGEDRLRSLVWRNQLGFNSRSHPHARLSIQEPVVSTTSAVARLPRLSCLGVVAAVRPGSTAVLAEAGEFYGLDVYSTTPEHAATVLDRAVRERWPLLGFALQGLTALPEPWVRLMRAYVDRGGTLLLNGIGPESDRWLDTITHGFDMDMPRALRLEAPSCEILFTSRNRAFAAEFAGVAVELACTSALNDSEGWQALAWVRAGGRLVPAVSSRSIGAGRVVVSAGASEISRLADAMAPLQALTTLPVMMLIRQVYGEAAWHPPASFANFVIDDPALRRGALGLDYTRALDRAREWDFHLTVATIPRELVLAEPEVVGLLRSHGHWLSACYHGSDHDGYEFYLPEADESRYRARPLTGQESALQRAVDRGDRFAESMGVALDRVMVFPHGVGSPQIFGTLQSLGFIAACNFDDRYPLGAPTPDDFDLGMRPADLAWAGFPLLWRRGLPDRMFLLDLFLGRPAITFAHAKAVGADLSAFADRAEEIHRIAGGGVRWTSLEDIARHGYLQRRDPEQGWKASMYSNEICLHNPDRRTRRYMVQRPNRPEGYRLVTDGPSELTERGLTLAVGPGDCRTIQVVSATSRTLAAGRPCSLLGAAAERSTPEHRGTNAHRRANSGSN